MSIAMRHNRLRTGYCNRTVPLYLEVMNVGCQRCDNDDHNNDNDEDIVHDDDDEKDL